MQIPLQLLLSHLALVTALSEQNDVTNQKLDDSSLQSIEFGYRPESIGQFSSIPRPDTNGRHFKPRIDRIDHVIRAVDRVDRSEGLLAPADLVDSVLDAVGIKGAPRDQIKNFVKNLEKGAGQNAKQVTDAINKMMKEIEKSANSKDGKSVGEIIGGTLKSLGVKISDEQIDKIDAVIDQLEKEGEKKEGNKNQNNNGNKKPENKGPKNDGGKSDLELNKGAYNMDVLLGKIGKNSGSSRPKPTVPPPPPPGFTYTPYTNPYAKAPATPSFTPYTNPYAKAPAATYVPLYPPETSYVTVYAPPLSQYIPPQPSKYTPPPPPVFIQPPPVYAKSSPTYVQPKPTYIQPLPTYVQPLPTYIQPLPTYIQPLPTYVQPLPTYVQPLPTYVQPAPQYQYTEAPYPWPQPQNAAQPQYAQPQYSPLPQPQYAQPPYNPSPTPTWQQQAAVPSPTWAVAPGFRPLVDGVWVPGPASKEPVVVLGPTYTYFSGYIGETASPIGSWETEAAAPSYDAAVPSYDPAAPTYDAPTPTSDSYQWPTPTNETPSSIYEASTLAYALPATETVTVYVTATAPSRVL